MSEIEQIVLVLSRIADAVEKIADNIDLVVDAGKPAFRDPEGWANTRAAVPPHIRVGSLGDD